MLTGFVQTFESVYIIQIYGNTENKADLEYGKQIVKIYTRTRRDGDKMEAKFLSDLQKPLYFGFSN